MIIFLWIPYLVTRLHSNFFKDDNPFTWVCILINQYKVILYLLCKYKYYIEETIVCNEIILISNLKNNITFNSFWYNKASLGVQRFKKLKK